MEKKKAALLVRPNARTVMRVSEMVRSTCLAPNGNLNVAVRVESKQWMQKMSGRLWKALVALHKVQPCVP